MKRPVAGAKSITGEILLMPVGIDHRDCTDIIEPHPLVLRQLQSDRRDIVGELFPIATANYERSDAGPFQKPRKGDLCG